MMSDYTFLDTTKYVNLECYVATCLLQVMHMHSNMLNTTSSCFGTVWIDVILSYGTRRKSELKLGHLLDLVIH